MDDIELLPCPFCGGQAKIQEIGMTFTTTDENGNRVSYEMVAAGCTNEECPVNAYTKECYTPEQATDAWNTRA